MVKKTAVLILYNFFTRAKGDNGDSLHKPKFIKMLHSHFAPGAEDRLTGRGARLTIRREQGTGDRPQVPHLAAIVQPANCPPIGWPVPGRGGSYLPPLPQIRTCPIKASGSSRCGLTCAVTVHRKPCVDEYTNHFRGGCRLSDRVKLLLVNCSC
jgi:hypothetical protein